MPGSRAQRVHQRHQPFGQVGGEVAAIALAPQHVARAGEDARVVVAARAQQAAGPEFDVRRIDQDPGQVAHAGI